MLVRMPVYRKFISESRIFKKKILARFEHIRLCQGCQRFFCSARLSTNSGYVFGQTMAQAILWTESAVSTELKNGSGFCLQGLIAGEVFEPTTTPVVHNRLKKSARKKRVSNLRPPWESGVWDCKCLFSKRIDSCS